MSPADRALGHRPCLLLIGGMDPTGLAGLARDIAVCVDERVHPCPVTTAVTVQSSEAFSGRGAVGADHLIRQAEAALAEIRGLRAAPTGARPLQAEVTDAQPRQAAPPTPGRATPGPTWCKAGMLADGAQVDAVARLVDRHDLHLVLDPVLATSSGGRLLDDDAIGPLRRLVARAAMVTPNLEEARVLTDDAEANAVEAAAALVGLGADAALVTQGGTGPDVLHDGLAVHTFPTAPVAGRHRGTGCRLATTVACHLARGTPPAQAVAVAQGVLRESLDADADEQGLHGPRLAQFRELDAWLPRILAAVRHEDVPEVGMNVAYALPGATDGRDVLGLAGRITIAGFGLGVVGRLRYGGPHHTGRIAVVLQEHDADARIVMNHRYDDVYLDNARASGLTDAGFRREDEPADAPSSMEWGVRHAIRAHGAVPDLIWDRGGPGKEAMIRIIAQHPKALVDKLHRLHGPTAGGPEARTRGQVGDGPRHLPA